MFIMSLEGLRPIFYLTLILEMHCYENNNVDRLMAF